MIPSAPLSTVNTPEITETRECLMETVDRSPVPNNRISSRFDIVLVALCCLGFLIYLIKSDSIRYFALHLGVRH